MMSAGSQTEPGGYTGQGKENLHHTVRGRQVPLPAESQEQKATEQFEVADGRSPAEVARMLGSLQLEAVWKDWDTAILGAL
jgi:2-iminoacetate synthase